MNRVGTTLKNCNFAKRHHFKPVPQRVTSCKRIESRETIMTKQKLNNIIYRIIIYGG